MLVNSTTLYNDIECEKTPVLNKYNYTAVNKAAAKRISSAHVMLMLSTVYRVACTVEMLPLYTEYSKKPKRNGKYYK